MAAKIELVPHDPSWPQQFATEAARIAEVFGPRARRIDHVGSTAVPGLLAKPVIDIQIAVDTLHPLAPLARLLARLDYTHMPSPDDETYPFFHRPSRWPHTHHVHLCVHGSEIERRQLALPAYLRDHPAEAQAYAAEKRRLAAIHVGATRNTREAYADAKSPFIEPLIEEALRLGYPRK